ncbi:MAG TPA: glyoxylate/hydroxypyruvate reductase A [Alphaproteobacteria bacterium]|nr:glyoxylate/hydroxypyruvate reductase A [Alphaproteobacteria bacterium]
MKPPTMLFACTGVDRNPWLAGFASEAPDLEIRLWPDVGNPAEIDYAFVWKPPADLFADLINLKAVFSLGAGVESLLKGDFLPVGVPLVRMVDPSLAIGMNEFVLMRVLHYHRRMHEHEAFQKLAQWVPLIPKLPEDRSVGIMGLGNLGGACAATLCSLGFSVRGWSREPKVVPGVRTYSGREGLADFLEGTEILVCLLPLTQETEGIVNADLLAQLPKGACLVNVARGAHVVDRDLLDSLDRGHIAAATLDVFQDEPLPADHPYWRHPRVTVVPHCSALTQPKTAVRTLVANLRRHLCGEPLSNVVDTLRGY